MIIAFIIMYSVIILLLAIACISSVKLLYKV